MKVNVELSWDDAKTLAALISCWRGNIPRSEDEKRMFDRLEHAIVCALPTSSEVNAVFRAEIRDDSPLHTLWTKAKDHPDYVKAEWMALEKKFARPVR